MVLEIKKVGCDKDRDLRHDMMQIKFKVVRYCINFETAYMQLYIELGESKKMVLSTC